jgi:hypothetical protein
VTFYDPAEYVKPVDQMVFFSRLLNMFNIFRSHFENNYREFFYKMRLVTFLKRDNNFGENKIRGMT